MDRRTFLRLGGTAAAAGMTSLAGCSLLGGSSSASPSWLYDPSQLAPARNIGFMSADLAQLYTLQQELPVGSDEPAAGASSPISPSDLDGFYAVGGFSFVSNHGRPVGFGSMCLTGSFPADRIKQYASLVSSGGGEPMTNYDYTLYLIENDRVSGGASPLDSSVEESLQLQSEQTPQKVALAVGDGAIVSGTTNPRAKDVKPRQTVRQMIAAKQGDAPVLYSKSNTDTKYARSISKRFQNPTVLMGATVDPAAVTLITMGVSLALSSLDVDQAPVGDAAAMVFENLFEDIRGAAFGATMGVETTTAKMVLTYRYANSARSTGLVQLFDAAKSYSRRQPGIDEIDAKYEGKNIVMTVTGDTETMLSEGQSGTVGTDADPLA